MTTNRLQERRALLEEQLRSARAEMGVRALNNESISFFEAAEREIEAIDAAEAEEVRRGRTADARAGAERVTKLRAKLAEQQASYLEHVSAFEASWRQALAHRTAALADREQLAKTVHAMCGGVPLGLGETSTVSRWSSWMSSVWGGAQKFPRRFGGVSWSASPYKSTDDLVDLESAVLSRSLEPLKGKANGSASSTED